MQAGLDAMWPYVGELFEADDLDQRVTAAGVGLDPSTLRASWDSYVDDVIGRATLQRPTAAWRSTGGRLGLHTESFGYLLAELQHLHRSHPGASW
jgi:ring-1,2-phenylacetyl-CoA epoxidase subunit PaaC